jgi:hypothetical protein
MAMGTMIVAGMIMIAMIVAHCFILSKKEVDVKAAQHRPDWFDRLGLA